MEIGNTLSTAFRITWQHKKLWVIALFPWVLQIIFGVIIAAVLLGSGALAFFATLGSDIFRPGFEPAQLGEQLIAAIGGALAALLCVSAIAAVLSIIVQLVTSGALIDGVWQAQTRNSIDLGAAISAGFRNSGRMFGLSFLLALPVLLLYVCSAVAFVGLGLGASQNQDMGEALIGSMLCLIFPLVCVIMIYALVAGAIGVLAQPAIVINNEGVVGSLSTGWRLVRQNLGNVIAMGLLLIVIFFVASLAIGLVSQIFTGPIVADMQTQLNGINTSDPAAFMQMFGALFGPAFWISTIVQQIVGGVLSLFLVVVSSAAWTLAYAQFENRLQLTSGETPPPSLPQP
jgi:hypothetical protein